MRGESNGLPFVIEAALAVVERGKGRDFHGVNFSPSFGDPMQGSALTNQEFSGYDFEGVLRNGHAHPRDKESPDTVAAFHIISPGLRSWTRENRASKRRRN
jgi:hypothetical protein